jgi:hypothetical protein
MNRSLLRVSPTRVHASLVGHETLLNVNDSRDALESFATCFIATGLHDAPPDDDLKKAAPSW